MNLAHIINRKHNRLKRCNKKLSEKELGTDQRSRLSQRASELERELKITKK